MVRLRTDINCMDMTMSRRNMLLAGLGLFVSGCTQTTRSLVRRPGPAWPTASQPRDSRGIVVGPRSSPIRPPAGVRTTGLVNAIPRSRWTRSHPITGRVNPMQVINRITVHHEGWTTFWQTDEPSTAARLEKIRTVHTRDRKCGDLCGNLPN